MFLTACSDSVDAEEATIDQAASMEIFTELNSQVMLIAFSSIYQKNGGEAISELNEATLNDTVINETASCEGGGTITVTGTVTSNAFQNGTGTFGYDLRQIPQDCRISTTKGTFSVDGNPDLRITTNINYEEWEPVGLFEFSYRGGYTWDGPGGSGGCDMNLTYGFNYSTQQVSMKGHMCGFSMDI